ncbi:ABC transporter permease [Extibacter muris]|uniref:ABC transporter permease n=1 Tax=Extibacter muris TaxID=1796622 RepID=UPI001D0773A7|nr:ABC transporter permease [Extibacter muris]MCB6203238.1 ABC transporter permease [Extibacter muris]MCQ4664834.1 ABC transporter permease [Extibacter muris]MCQ4694843.1 ABC transporter permease [Extibacter muris]
MNIKEKINTKDVLRKSAVLIVLLILIIVFSNMSPQFRTMGNLITILRQISMLGVVSVGMTIVLISGGIDLSVGSQLSIVGVVTAMGYAKWGMPPAACILMGLAVGSFIGFFNGFVITKTGMPPMIATLAMQIMIRGLGFIICDGASVYGLPGSFKLFGQGYIGPFPIPVLIMAVILFLSAFMLNRTYIGRYFYAVGSNEEATRLSGLNTNRIKMLSYAICGFLSAVAGIIMMSRVNSGQPKAGDGFEMDVLTACVVGGVSISGGEGRTSHILVGALIMGVLSNGLVIVGVSEYWQQVAKGAVLLFAVGLDSVQRIGLKKKKAK